ncbi:MAG TPA: hypothetical protein VFD20_05225 [Demequina sp.]|nr:hypothetical protein [Demequina sp.]
MADTEGVEARARARAAMERLCQRLAEGEPPDASADRDLAALAARIDATLWNHHGTEAPAR